MSSCICLLVVVSVFMSVYMYVYLVKLQCISLSIYPTMYMSISIYLSLHVGSKPVGVDCVAIDFNRLILITVVLSSPNHQTLSSCPGLGPVWQSPRTLGTTYSRVHHD